MPAISPLKRLGQSRSQATVAVSPEEVAASESAALQKLGGGITVPGFRPGKAPNDQVKSRVNPDELLEETVRGVLPQAIASILKEHDLRPLLPPRVDVQSREPMVLLLTFVEKPEVKVKSMDTSAFGKKTEPKFDEKDIDRMVRYLLEQYRTMETVDRPAAEGDQVTMDFVGLSEDGAEIRGTRATGYQIVLGSKQLLPGFEDALAGMKTGDKKAVRLTFPERYHAEHLQGKPVTFQVEVKGVEKVSMPALTPEFVKEKGLGASPEDLRLRVAQSMREQEEEMDRQRREGQLFDAIRKATQVDIAPELIEEEERRLLEDIGRGLEESQETYEVWLTRTKRTPETLQKELREESQRRITLRFGIQTLLEDGKVELTPEETEEAVQRRLAEIPEEQRSQAATYYGPGGDGHEEVRWARRVEKLVKSMPV